VVEAESDREKGICKDDGTTCVYQVINIMLCVTDSTSDTMATPAERYMCTNWITPAEKYTIRMVAPSRYQIQLHDRLHDRQAIAAHEDMERKRLKQIAKEEVNKVDKSFKLECRTCMDSSLGYYDLVTLPNTTKLVRPFICKRCHDA
jgi:hypothetical protein